MDKWGAGVVFATIKDQIGLAKMSRCRSGMVKKCFELICRGYIRGGRYDAFFWVTSQNLE